VVEYLDDAIYLHRVLGSPFDQNGNQTSTGGIRLSFNPDANTLTGYIEVADDGSGSALGSLQRLHAAFGSLPGTGGRSSFIDDDIYAAREQRNPDGSATIHGETWIEIDDGSFAGEVPHLEPSGPNNNSPHTYLISADAVPLDNTATATPDDAAWMGGAQLCQNCAFMEWGWWGTATRHADPDGTDEIRTQVHLGTWVAGELPDPGQLPLAGSANYDGHAIGNVVVNNNAQYIAGGAMHMTWDFGSRDGQWDVSNFDNHSFGGAISDPASVPDPATGTFQGNLSVTARPEASGTSSGFVQGAFAENPAAPTGPTTAPGGVMGNFSVNDSTSSGGWSATGTFLGAGGQDP
jgi:hypothetical protein